MAWRRTIRSSRSVSSAGPFTATCVVASNLSVGSGVIVIFFSLAHLTTSAPLRAGPPGSVSGRLCATASWRGWHLVPVSRCVSAAGNSLLGHPIPAGELGSPHGRLTGPASGPRRGYRVPHARAATGVGAPYNPRTSGAHPAGSPPRPAPAASQRPVPKPRHDIPPCEALLHGPSTGVHSRSHVRSSPRPRPRGGTSGASASPRAPPPSGTRDPLWCHHGPSRWSADENSSAPHERISGRASRPSSRVSSKRHGVLAEIETAPPARIAPRVGRGLPRGAFGGVVTRLQLRVGSRGPG